MKLIIAGTRTLYAYNILQEAMVHFDLVKRVTEIVHGGSRGIDRNADRLALYMGLKPKVFKYNDMMGKAGGPARNSDMADYGDELLVIWNGNSDGSYNMKQNMIDRGKPVYEVILRTHNVKAENEQVPPIL